MRLFAHWQLDKQTYRHLHNVTLNTPDGTTQIDDVFLLPYDLFVLETKNMSSWIFDSEQQVQWTQKLYKRMFNSRTRCGRTTSTSKRWKPRSALSPSTYILHP